MKIKTQIYFKTTKLNNKGGGGKKAKHTLPDVSAKVH